MPAPPRDAVRAGPQTGMTLCFWQHDNITPTDAVCKVSPTKGHWRSPSRLADIERGLDYFAAHAAQWGLTSVAMPPLGCGNGGLEWGEVGPLIWRKLHALPIDVVQRMGGKRLRDRVVCP